MVTSRRPRRQISLRQREGRTRPVFTTYGTQVPGVDLSELHGYLIVIEGADGSGRTTECQMLKDYLEVQGRAVLETGLRRSSLVSEQIDEAKRGNVLGSTTMSLIYTVDFADQLENKIIPALAAGHVVLADRYIFTLMARAIVRGASREWAEHLYEFALRPNLTIFLDTRPEILLHRVFSRYQSLDYWESGMDIGLSRDRFESFYRYQDLLKTEFHWMSKKFDFVTVNANRSPEEVHRDVRACVQGLFGGTRIESFR